jgi:PAS domain-containing protein
VTVVEVWGAAEGASAEVDVDDEGIRGDGTTPDASSSASPGGLPVTAAPAIQPQIRLDSLVVYAEPVDRVEDLTWWQTMAVYDHSPLAILCASNDGIITYANAAAVGLFSTSSLVAGSDSPAAATGAVGAEAAALSASSLIGTRVSALFPHSPTLLETLIVDQPDASDSTANVKPAVMRVQAVRNSKEIFWAEVRVEDVRVPGLDQRSTLLIRDVSHEALADEQLLLSHAMEDLAGLAVLRVDPLGALLHASPAATRLFRGTATEAPSLIGFNVKAILPEYDLLLVSIAERHRRVFDSSAAPASHHLAPHVDPQNLQPRRPRGSAANATSSNDLSVAVARDATRLREIQTIWGKSVDGHTTFPLRVHVRVDQEDAGGASQRQVLAIYLQNLRTPIDMRLSTRHTIAIMDLSPDAMFIVDEEATILRVNPAALAMFLGVEYFSAPLQQQQQQQQQQRAGGGIATATTLGTSGTNNASLNASTATTTTTATPAATPAATDGAAAAVPPTATELPSTTPVEPEPRLRHAEESKDTSAYLAELFGATSVASVAVLGQLTPSSATTGRAQQQPPPSAAAADAAAIVSAAPEGLFRRALLEFLGRNLQLVLPGSVTALERSQLAGSNSSREGADGAALIARCLESARQRKGVAATATNDDLVWTHRVTARTLPARSPGAGATTGAGVEFYATATVSQVFVPDTTATATATGSDTVGSLPLALSTTPLPTTVDADGVPHFLPSPPAPPRRLFVVALRDAAPALRLAATGAVTTGLVDALAPCAVVTVDARGNVADVSRAALDLFGCRGRGAAASASAASTVPADEVTWGDASSSPPSSQGVTQQEQGHPQVVIGHPISVVLPQATLEYLREAAGQPARVTTGRHTGTNAVFGVNLYVAAAPVPEFGEEQFLCFVEKN